jgi:exodeoxyribonuclease V gamma subunit
MLNVVVAEEVEVLLDRLAHVLAEPLADAFATEVVVVPAAGTAAWLRRRLSERLGCSAEGRADGILANVAFEFPGRLLTRALGPLDRGGWEVDRLTWAILEILTTDRPAGLERVAPTATTARRLADRFDHYAVHRPEMVRSWAGGLDVDGAGTLLPEPQRWQPTLWRAVAGLLGEPSLPERLPDLIADLADGRIVPELPRRCSVFGTSSLPPTHLAVLRALAVEREVSLFLPTPSVALVRGVARRLREAPLVHPLLRETDPTRGVASHPLLVTWGRTHREAAVLLDPPADAELLPAQASSATLLGLLQSAIRADTPPPGEPAADEDDPRPELAPGDRSVQVHACYGLARQAEVLRDEILHRLAADPDLRPADITILCPDVAAFVPLLTAAFAAVPPGATHLRFRVVDRSLTGENPVLAATAALLELVTGRCRASDVLDFASLRPVQTAVGLTDAHVARAAEWVEAVGVRWGLDGPSRTAFGLPAELEAHTWRAGLDQLLLGAAMADLGPRFGPGGVAPYADVEGDDLTAAGLLAELLDRIGTARERLARPQPMADWCDALAAATRTLVAADDRDAWQLDVLDHLLASLAEDAVVDGRSCPVPIEPADFRVLVEAKLAAPPRRVGRDDGAVVLASPSGVRGIPSRVVCLLGLDTDALPGASTAADDILATSPCIGDRDPRSELRAQLLDALLSARDHLVVTYTGRDLKTNQRIPPAVPLAELLDVVAATVRLPGQGAPHQRDRSPFHPVEVLHPRQPFGVRNLQADTLGIDGPWSFDPAAVDAALARAHRRGRAPFLAEPLPPPPPGPDGTLVFRDLVEAVEHPTRFFLRRRMGVVVPRDGEPRDDLIPVALGNLEGWAVRDRLLEARLEGRPVDAWAEHERATGALPPGRLADPIVAEAEEFLGELEKAAGKAGVAIAEGTRLPIDVVVPQGRIVTELSGMQGHRQVVLTASGLKAKDRLAAWVRLVLLTLADPAQEWETVVVGRKPREGKRAFTLRQAGATPTERTASAHVALTVLTDLLARARTEPLPFHPETSAALVRKGAGAAAKAWSDRYGEAADVYRRLVLGDAAFEDLRGESPRPDETGGSWPRGADRLEVWARWVWGAFDATVEVSEAR